MPRRFHVVFRKPGAQNAKKLIVADNADAALKSIGYPETRVFSLMEYMTYEQIEDLARKAPGGRVPRSEDWEQEHGPVTAGVHLWVEPTQDARDKRHRLCEGRLTVRVCERTGHVRLATIGEYYGNWTTPERNAA